MHAYVIHSYTHIHKHIHTVLADPLRPVKPDFDQIFIDNDVERSVYMDLCMWVYMNAWF